MFTLLATSVFCFVRSVIVLVPGPVAGLAFTSISATVLQISWTRPEVTNGEIRLYSILVETHAGPLFQENVPGEQSSTLIPNFSKL